MVKILLNRAVTAGLMLPPFAAYLEAHSITRKKERSDDRSAGGHRPLARA